MQLLNKFSRTLGLRTKMFILFGGLCSVVVIALVMVRLFGLPLLGDDGALKRINMRAEQRIELVAAYKHQMLQHWFSGCQFELQRLARHKPVLATLRQITTTDEHKHTAALQQLTKRLEYFCATSPSFDTTYFAATPSGQIIATSKLLATDITFGETFLARAIAHPESVTVDTYHNSDHSNCGVVFAQTVLDPASSRPLGIFIATSSMNNFMYDILYNVNGLGATAEVVLVDQDNNPIFHCKHKTKGLRTKKDWNSRKEGCPLMLAAKGGHGVTYSIDYRGQAVVAAYRYIRFDDRHGWGMVVKQDREETAQLLLGRIRGSVATGSAGIVLVLLGVFFISRH
ncbi:MAG: cache domain-containing protein, partial [Thermodesulfobacteriota bacterium]|nr:cache domain-containing protein [Thermodesulfobacteriota bacterium]